MPKSLFRDRTPAAEPDRQERFIKLIDGLIETLELRQNLDIRDRIAALALIDRVLSKEKPDESNRGSAVKRYEGLFQKAAGDPGGETDPGPAADDSDADGNGADPESCVPRNAR